MSAQHLWSHLGRTKSARCVISVRLVPIEQDIVTAVDAKKVVFSSSCVASNEKRVYDHTLLPYNNTNPLHSSASLT